MAIFKDLDTKIYELKRSGIAQDEIKIYEELEKINTNDVEKAEKLHKLEEKIFNKIQREDKRIEHLENKLDKMREKARSSWKAKIQQNILLESKR